MDVVNQEGLNHLIELIHANVARRNSPTLTGEPRSTTPFLNDNSTRIATTAYVQNAIANFEAEQGEQEEPESIPEDEIYEVWDLDAMSLKDFAKDNIEKEYYGTVLIPETTNNTTNVDPGEMT